MLIIFLFLLGLLDESFAEPWCLGVIVMVSSTVLRSQTMYCTTITTLKYTRHSYQGEQESRDYAQAIKKNFFFKYRDALKPRNLNRQVARKHCINVFNKRN